MWSAQTNRRTGFRDKLSRIIGSSEVSKRCASFLANKSSYPRFNKLTSHLGAVNPRDSDLKITSEGDELVFNGFKNFNTGGVVSDATILEGVLEDTGEHIFTIARTNQAGMQFSHNWDNVGLRLTESGSVKIENVRVPWSDAFGWDPATKRPIEAVLTIPFATMLLPT